MKSPGTQWWRALALAAAAASVVACGGGGGGAPGPAVPGSISLVAGSLQRAGSSDGVGIQAQFSSPQGVAQDAAGNLFVADASTIRKITPQGEVRTVAGTPGQNLAAPGPLPGSIGRVMGLAWYAGVLYATVENAVLAIGPLN